MIIDFKEAFDLQKTGNCGQAFRWKMIDEDSCQVRAGSRECLLRGIDEEKIEVECEKADESFWENYLDTSTNYLSIADMVDRKDIHLLQCAENAKGIRILRQDPFEMLITFIISQRKSMPAIRTSVERLCEACGAGGFPEAKQIAALSNEELVACGLGYRVEYVKQAAKKVAEGTIDLASYEGLSDEALKEKLMEIQGVGEKVASCVMLFGYHRLNAFPKDVWINRELQAHYPQGFDYKRYEPYCGVMQQYLFYGATHRK